MNEAETVEDFRDRLLLGVTKKATDGPKSKDRHIESGTMNL